MSKFMSFMGFFILIHAYFFCEAWFSGSRVNTSPEPPNAPCASTLPEGQQQDQSRETCGTSEEGCKEIKSCDNIQVSRDIWLSQGYILTILSSSILQDLISILYYPITTSHWWALSLLLHFSCLFQMSLHLHGKLKFLLHYSKTSQTRTNLEKSSFDLANNLTYPCFFPSHYP